MSVQFVKMSAFKTCLADSENLSNHVSLEQELRKISVVGPIVPVTEVHNGCAKLSYLIFFKKESQAMSALVRLIELLKKYEQDSLLWSDANGLVSLVNASGEFQETGKRLARISMDEATKMLGYTKLESQYYALT